VFIRPSVAPRTAMAKVIAWTYDMRANDALSGRGPTEQQETRWSVPAVRLNA
jgi:hypothetical protein